MARISLPRVDDWYLNRETGEQFRVVAIDELTGDVEVQYLDGDIDEFDAASWQDLSLEATGAPEDWRMPFALSPEDYAEAEGGEWHGLLETDALSLLEPETPWFEGFP